MRKEKIVQAKDFCGRDYAAKRIYKIKEWPAARAEKWGIRAALSFNSKGTVQIPMSWAGIGWEGLAVLGINAFLGGGMDPEVVIPILDELLECVTIIRDPKLRDAQGAVMSTALVSDDDIEEVITRGWLRSEVFELHSGFSPADALSRWLSTVERRWDLSKIISDIQTSAPSSDSPSPDAPS